MSKKAEYRHPIMSCSGRVRKPLSMVVHSYDQCQEKAKELMKVCGESWGLCCRCLLNAEFSDSTSSAAPEVNVPSQHGR